MLGIKSVADYKDHNILQMRESRHWLGLQLKNLYSHRFLISSHYFVDWQS
jgi:hypothetical protein